MYAAALREKVARALADLGDSPDTVAAVLSAAGCLGVRRAANKCPVRHYLQRILGPETFVSVGPFDVLVTLPETLVVVGMPRAVERFILGFDRSQYRALEARARHVAYCPRLGYRLLYTCPLPRLPVAMSIEQCGVGTVTARHDHLGVN